MPKLSDDTLFARALPIAIADRDALADCYPRNSEQWKEARGEADSMRKLVGRKLAQLTGDEQHLAFAVFFHAEQWEETLADSVRTSNRKVSTDSLRNVRLFREVRHRRWGKSRQEVAFETAESVSLDDLMARISTSKPTA